MARPDPSADVTRTTPNNIPTLELARKRNGGHGSFTSVSASVAVYATLSHSNTRRLSSHTAWYEGDDENEAGVSD